MKNLIRFAFIAVLAVSTGACAQLHSAETTLRNVVSVAGSVTPNDVYVAINVYDGVEATATNYNRWPRCTGANAPCRDSAVRAQIKKVILAGRVARNQLKAFLRANPGLNLAVGSLADLQAATTSLQTIINTYKIS